MPRNNRNTSSTQLFLELFILYAVLPISLVLPYHIMVKVVTVLFGFTYLVFTYKKHYGFESKLPTKETWRVFYPSLIPRFLGVIALTTCYVYVVDASLLFCVPKTNPLLFTGILIVYSLLSVWPQEFIYRTFFFKRYGAFFKSTWLLIFVSALFFSLAHLFFQNLLVIVFTFIGGLFFGLTYYKHRSTLLVTLEHSLYGCWLFTVGMGEMLAFPGMGAC